MRLTPETRWGMLGRFALGALIVIAFTAATTAVAGLLQFKQLAYEIGGSPSLKAPHVTIAKPGHSQTILIIGSDHRVGTSFRTANTDTMMLVRLNPDSQTINVISVPRDLRVQIPQGGATSTGKLNSAYSVGGPDLLIKILKDQVFHGLQVNHIVDINFGGFESLVNAIGCIYTDVDHRYYNLTTYTGYSSIDLQPGYQKLCGADALSFVRFRHTDSDIVRNARQQDFVRWAKDQYGVTQLIDNRDKLLKIFGHHTQTDSDLHSVDGLINLFNLVAFSAGHTIKQIPFPAVLLPCAGGGPGGRGFVGSPCYVTADHGAEQRAFQAFMAVSRSAPSHPAPHAPAPPHRAHHPSGPAPSDLISAVSDGKAQLAALGNARMPVYYPKAIASGSRYCTNDTCSTPKPDSYPRNYQIAGTHNLGFPAYRLTLVLNPALGQYYAVQGTLWTSPPILNHPNQTRVVGGKRLLLYFNGHKLTLVGWRTHDAVYWVSNTLTDDLSGEQMLGIAASLTRG